MSATDELPEGDDPSPNAVLSGTIGFLDRGGNLGTLLQGALFGTLVSVFTGGINLIQSIVGLVTAPIDSLGVATTATIEAIIVAPLSIVSESAAASAAGISDQFGPFAFLVGIGVLLGGFFLVTRYLEEEETSDTFVVPGLPDIPFVGVTEEGEDDE